MGSIGSAFAQNRLSCRGLAILSAACLSGLIAADAHAATIAVNNPNFATDNSDWSTWFEVGAAGENDPITNPGGSSQSFYSQAGGVANASAPSGTTGVFTMDAGNVAPPPGDPSDYSTLYPESDITVFDPSTARITSVGGALGSYYQDVAETFAPDTTYTLSAYAGGDTTGFSNTGVALSGGSNLTLAELNSDPNLASLGQTGSASLVQRTVTIDTGLPQFAGLIGEDIVVNLVSNANSYYGRQQAFSNVVLTDTTVVVKFEIHASSTSNS